MTRYEVTVTTTGSYEIETDLPAGEVETRIYEAIAELGHDSWTDRYTPWIREEWARHPRKYAKALREAPPCDMDVSDIDSGDEIDIQEVEA